MKHDAPSVVQMGNPSAVLASPLGAVAAGSAMDAWIISANRALIEKIEDVLRPLAPRWQVLSSAAMTDELEAALRQAAPTLIIIDIGSDMDWGQALIQRIKRTLVPSSTVVLTQQFSREFGAKILSGGISYYFPHDFCRQEFRRLMISLIGTRPLEHGPECPDR